MAAPYLIHVKRQPIESAKNNDFRWNLPFTQNLDLEIDSPVTFFVGENGSGKSTLLEGIAVLAGFPIAGGSTNEVAETYGVEESSLLADGIRVGFKKRPDDGYFFRADLQSHFASLLDQRKRDPDFAGDPYQRYGGKSLHMQSHGEAFLSVIQNRITDGIFFLDEPESALSPQRQLTLLAMMYDRVQAGKTQFLIATHSPILLTFPQAKIISFDESGLCTQTLEETRHYQITSGILNHPESYWKHLRNDNNE